MSQIIKNSLIVLSASVLFGIYPPAARGAYADGANAVFIIMLTTLLRAASMTAFCIVKGHGLFVDREETKIAIRSGFIQACSVIGILGSLVYLPGPVAIVLLFTNTLMLLFFLWLKKELEVNQWLLIATVACLIGISFVVDVWNIHSLGDWRGYVLIMIGAAATASRLYIFGKLTQRKEPIVVGAETFLWAFCFLCLLPFYQMPILPQSISGFGWVFLSAVSLSLGSFAMFYGIAKIGAFHFSLYNKLEPVFGAIFSAILIGEILNLTQYIGMVIVIGSLVGYQLWDYRQRKNKS